MKLVQFAKILIAVDDRIEQRKSGDIGARDSGEQGQGGAEAQSDQQDLINTGAFFNLADCRRDISEPGMQIGWIRVTGGIAAALQIEAQHGKSLAGEPLGQLAKCAMKADILITNR